LVVDTKKENNLTVHIVKSLPQNPEKTFKAVVSEKSRTLSANNHSVTHLLHFALRKVLGSHIEQKGSMVKEDMLRFDFSHFEKISEEKIKEVEHIVNTMIRRNIPLVEKRDVSLKEAKEMGAIMLFGEKYGEKVRVIKFDESVELCGGTHVPATGQIGMFKILSEGAIAAGVRRIEAVTADAAEDYFNSKLEELNEIYAQFKNSHNAVKSVADIISENKMLHKQIEKLNAAKAGNIKEDLKKSAQNINGVNFVSAKIGADMKTVKNLVFALVKELDDVFVIIGSHDNGKANLTVALSQDLIKEKSLHAGNLVRELAKEINGGGGGQAHFASAGGKNADGIDKALDKAKNILSEL